MIVVNPMRARVPFWSSIIFQCLTHSVSVSDPILRYGWYHRLGNRVSLLQFGSNNTLTLEQVREENGGQYICEVETRNGVKQNATSTLVIFGKWSLKVMQHL